jgi:hypothetical protein
MPRNLPSPMLAAIQANSVQLAFLLDLQLAGNIWARAWTGVGTLVWNGNSYLGVGSLGAIDDIQEGSEVKAEGTTVALSGVDPTLLGAALTEIQVGASATAWLAVFTNGALTAAYTVFGGTVDRAQVAAGVNAMTIALALETKLANLQRASNRRYTAADQRRNYPDDGGFNFVEVQNDIALLWG